MSHRTGHNLLIVLDKLEDIYFMSLSTEELMTLEQYFEEYRQLGYGEVKAAEKAYRKLSDEDTDWSE